MIELMVRVEPDDEKRVFDDKSVDATVFVGGQRELPRFLVEQLAFRDAEAVRRDSLVSEINPMESDGRVGLSILKRPHFKTR